jgi:hypothetical protein
LLRLECTERTDFLSEIEIVDCQAGSDDAAVDVDGGEFRRRGDRIIHIVIALALQAGRGRAKYIETGIRHRDPLRRDFNRFARGAGEIRRSKTETPSRTKIIFWRFFIDIGASRYLRDCGAADAGSDSAPRPDWFNSEGQMHLSVISSLGIIEGFPWQHNALSAAKTLMSESDRCLRKLLLRNVENGIFLHADCVHWRVGCAIL